MRRWRSTRWGSNRRAVPLRATAERVWARMSGETPPSNPAFLLEVGRPGRHRFRYLAVNDAFRSRLAGHGIDDATAIVGRTPRDVLPRSFAAAAEQRYEQVVSSGKPIVYQAGFELADGSLGYEVVLDPIGDARGECTHLLGTARERVARDQEVALRDHERRFAALVEQSSDIVMVVDTDGYVSYASPAAKRVLGWPSDEFRRGDDEVTGRSGFDIIHPDDLDIALQLLEEDDEDGEHGMDHCIELRAARADGSYVWLEVVATDRTDDPAIGGVVVNARDITERKAAEVDLEASHEYFRSLVQHASEYVTVTGTDGNYIYVSPSVVEFTGRSVRGPGRWPTHRDPSRRRRHGLRSPRTTA